VTCNRRVEDFVAQFTRWHVIQRHATGNAAYAAQLLLNPSFLAVGGLLASPGLRTLFATAAFCVCKIALDGAAGHALRSGGFRISTLALVPFKDMLIGAAWVYGLVVNRVNGIGHPLRILRMLKDHTNKSPVRYRKVTPPALPAIAPN
jgi:hypothetical protein